MYGDQSPAALLVPTVEEQCAGNARGPWVPSHFANIMTRWTWLNVLIYTLNHTPCPSTQTCSTAKTDLTKRSEPGFWWGHACDLAGNRAPTPTPHHNTSLSYTAKSICSTGVRSTPQAAALAHGYIGPYLKRFDAHLVYLHIHIPDSFPQLQTEPTDQTLTQTQTHMQHSTPITRPTRHGSTYLVP